MSINLFRSRAVRLLAVTCASVLLVGCSGSVSSDMGSPDMMNLSDVTEGANADDVMFAQMMIPHHEQAVVMADLAADRTQDPQLSGLAKEIKAAQDPEIRLMLSWLEQWDVPQLSQSEALSTHGSHGMDGMLSDAQLEALASASGDTFDALFAQYMIEHHQGAVSMANDVLARGAHPAVATLAREIIVTQEKEITQLQAFLNGSSTGALTQISPALGHVHGVVVKGDRLVLGTHDGIHEVDPATGESVRIGSSRDDFMAFSGDMDSTFVASGHPGPGSTAPNPLGLVVSADGGKTWEPRSLQGVVDFHGLAIQEGEIVGWDTRGALQWSQDLGESWQAGPLVTPTSLAWFNAQVWMGSPDRGLLTWTPGSEELQEVGVPGVLLATSLGGGALWRLDRDGSVYRTIDGQSWAKEGAVTRVEAFAATRDSAFAVAGSSIEIISAQVD